MGECSECSFKSESANQVLARAKNFHGGNAQRLDPCQQR
jgi:hypothetical protein